MKITGLIIQLLLSISAFSQMETRSADTTVMNNFGKPRLIHIMEKGVFENGKLLNGQRDIYRDSVHLSYSIRVVNGNFSDTTFLAQIVNKRDSLGRKRGSWISTGSQCAYSVKDWQEFVACDVCKQFVFNENGAWDTTKTFDLTGKLVLERFVSNDSKFYVDRTFYPNGFKLSEKFESIDRAILLAGFSMVYSKSVRNQPTWKIYDTEVILFYENGIVVQKESPRWGHGRSMEMPTSFPIPYIIEKGVFENEKLVSGIIEYYDKEEKLVRTEKVPAADNSLK